MRITLLLLIAACCLTGVTSTAQTTLSGRVTDARTREPLAFVNILLNDGPGGTVSDIDGKFSLQTPRPIIKLRFSYIGYETMNISGSRLTDGLQVKMKKTEVELAAVSIVPGENPALRIIRNAMQQRDKNNYENLPSFNYSAYEKTIFTIDADSLLYTDTLRLDSSERALRRFLETRDFFMIENHLERSFKQPGQNLQKIKATKVSGFKDPVFIFLLSRLQSSSFYEDIIRIGDRNYINPLARGSLNRYFFQIEDTLVHGPDTTFSVFYRPWKGTRFDGLEGILNISTKGWGIESVTAKPHEEPKDLGIRVQQLYTSDSNGIWFPKQLNTDLSFKTATVTTGQGQRKFTIIANGRTYIRDVSIGPAIPSRQFGHVEIDVDPLAAQRDENYWGMVRIDPLSTREAETYRFIDSLGRKQKFDRLAYVIDAAINGKIPLGRLSLDLNKLLKYNSHEGFVAGLGLETNDRISRFWQTGGFWGYGFGDKTAKYGGFFSLNFSRQHDLKLRYAYHFDKTESGSTAFPGQKKSLSDPASYRELLVNRMDLVQGHRLTLSFRTLRYVDVYLELTDHLKTPAYNYTFKGSGNAPLNKFSFTELSLALRWAWKEKFLQTARSRIPLSTPYPVVWLKYTRGTDALLRGKFDYHRLDFDLNWAVFTPFVGKTSIRLNAGITTGDIPAPNLYNARAAFGRFTLYAPGSFSVMRLNEFYTDRYVALFAAHNFQNLLYKGRRFRPEPEIFAQAILGRLSQPALHQGIVMQAPEKGYFEAGINLNRLLGMGFYHLGIGTAYRFGPYHLPKTADNLTVMITLNWNLQ